MNDPLSCCLRPHHLSTKSSVAVEVPLRTCTTPLSYKEINPSVMDRLVVSFGLVRSLYQSFLEPGAHFVFLPLFIIIQLALIHGSTH